MGSSIYDVPAVYGRPAQAAPAAFSGGYDGAVDSRFRQQQAFRRSFEGTEEHALPPYDRQRLILEGFDLERNNEVVAGLVERFPSYAVHTGLQPIPLSSDGAWNRLARDWWVHVFSPGCDFRGLCDMEDIQRLAVRSRMLAGECAVLPLANGQVQPVEGQRICTPSALARDSAVVDGIRFAGGRAVGAYICARSAGGAIDPGKFEYREFSAGFFRCWRPKRIDQVRGIPDLAPLINKIRDIDETDGSLLRKVKNEARQYMQNVSSENHTSPGNLGAMYQVEEKTDGTRSGFVKTAEGMVYFNPKNQKLEMLEGRSPNANVVSYLEWQLKIASACMNIPYAFMALIFENSYTAARAASMHADHTFEGINHWLGKRLMTPMWRWRIAMAIRRGELPPAPVDEGGRSEWDRVQWSIPFSGSLDREKSSRANLNEVELGKESVTTLLRAENRDRRDVWDTREEELRDSAVRAARLNGEFSSQGFRFTPADFTNSAQPGGRQNAAEPAAGNGNDDDTEE